jgi:ribosomal protein S12 methylthiotransferase accessory factor
MTDSSHLWDRLEDEAVQLRQRGRDDRYSDRVVCATDTVARMRQRFAHFGITRLADVTGLDKIGIPVWMAVRPNSKTLAVSQGKGLNEPAAQASAVMEAAEIATAERFPVATRISTIERLIAEGIRVDPLHGLLARGEKPPAATEPMRWVEGHDLLRNDNVWVAAEAVSLDAVEASGRRTRYWQSSDGLASGNILIEAVVHGLLERIERDASTLWLFRSDKDVFDCCIDPTTLNDEAVDGLARQIDGAGFQVRLFDISSDIGVPVMFAIIAPKPDGFEQHWKHFDISSGSGAHPSPSRAAIRAITEAAQSRVTSITGARDDFDPNLYGVTSKGDLTTYFRAAPLHRSGLDEIPRDPAENLLFIVERLRATGIGSAIVVPFDTGIEGFAVAKVLVPELEHPPGNRKKNYGRRALKLIMAQAKPL